MTIQEAAQQALAVQDACNLSGVAHALSHILTGVLWPEAHRIGKGTDWVNQHPICTLFIDKLCDLNRRAEMFTAWDAVEKLAKSGPAILEGG